MRLLDTIDPNRFISEERQKELIQIADEGNSATAVRQAIREAVASTVEFFNKSKPDE